MKPGQVAQLQELSKCSLLGRQGYLDARWVEYLLRHVDRKLDELDKNILHDMTHKYRHQIAAMRKNRK